MHFSWKNLSVYTLVILDLSHKISMGVFLKGLSLRQYSFLLWLMISSTWGPRFKYVDDLTAMEIVPRNSPSLMKFTVSEIQSFAWQNEIKSREM